MIELEKDRIARGNRKYSLRNAEWKESDHPRADDGKFGSGGGSKIDTVKKAQGTGNTESDPKIISSQRYLNEDVVEQKKEELKESGVESVDIPVTYVGDIDGTHYSIVRDGHHTMAAAKELGININFVQQDDSEGLTGNDLLEQRYIDSNYYDIATERDEW